MKTLGIILIGFFLIATLAGNASLASACQWNNGDIVTTVFDPTDNIHTP